VFIAVAVKVWVAPTVTVGSEGETITVATLTLSMAGPVGESPPPHEATKEETDAATDTVKARESAVNRLVPRMSAPS
jgi:hypothetical protein